MEIDRLHFRVHLIKALQKVPELIGADLHGDVCGIEGWIGIREAHAYRLVEPNDVVGVGPSLVRRI